MKDEAETGAQADAVRQIVVEMLDRGFQPAVLVFVASDGTTRLWHRDGLDAEDLLRFLLAADAAREVRH